MSQNLHSQVLLQYLSPSQQPRQPQTQPVQESLLHQDLQTSLFHFDCHFQTQLTPPSLEQGSLNFLHDVLGPQNWSESQPSKLKDLTAHISNSDFSSLKNAWNESMLKKLNFIEQNWWQFCLVYHQHLKNFISAVRRKINNHLTKNREPQKQEYYQIFYPNLTSTLEKLERKIEFSLPTAQEGTNNNLKMILNNNIFQNYVREQDTKACKAGACYIDVRQKNAEGKLEGPGEKIALGQYIANKNVFGQDRENWSKLLFVASAQHRYNKKNSEHVDIHEEIDSVYQFSEQLLNFNSLIEPSNRICCAQYFYYNYNFNPLNQENVIMYPQIFQFKEKEKNKKGKKMGIEATVPALIEEITLDLCALLNSGGGVLLFNCKQDYLDYRAIGESILESDKPKYKQILEKAVKKIYPEVKSEEQIKITFVPVVKNPYEQGYHKQTFEEDDIVINRLYIQGLYVLRVAAFPRIKNQVYFCQLSKDSTKAVKIQDGKRKTLSGLELVREMEEKFDYFENEEIEDELQRELLGKQVSDEHVCPEPYKGIPIVMRQEISGEEGPEQQYKFVSLLIAPSKQFKQIEKKLKKRGIDCKINTYFIEKYQNWKLPQNSAPIHHNIRFDQMLIAMTYHPDFIFDTRPALLINVTRCINLVNRKGVDQSALGQDDFDRLQDWLKRDPSFSKEKLEYWQYSVDGDPKNTEHYLRTSSFLSIIYIYFVLHNEKEKGLLKNPGLKYPESKGSKQQQRQQYKQIINEKMNLIYKDGSKAKFFDDI